MLVYNLRFFWSGSRIFPSHIIYNLKKLQMFAISSDGCISFLLRLWVGGGRQGVYHDNEEIKSLILSPQTYPSERAELHYEFDAAKKRRESWISISLCVASLFEKEKFLRKLWNSCKLLKLFGYCWWSHLRNCARTPAARVLFCFLVDSSFRTTICKTTSSRSFCTHVKITSLQTNTTGSLNSS